MENTTRELLMQYGGVLQQWLYPRLEEERGPLTEKHPQGVRGGGLARMEATVGASGGGVGRPPRDRRAMARAFVAKAVYHVATTRALLDWLPTDSRRRRIGGGERPGEVPDEPVCSRALAELARTELPQRTHQALLAKTPQERWIGPIRRDATAMAARERPVRKTEKTPAAEGPQRRRQRREPKPPEDRTRIERQRTLTLAPMLADLPRNGAGGGKTHRPGRQQTWRG